MRNNILEKSIKFYVNNKLIFYTKRSEPGSYVTLEFSEILLISATLCSSDTVAALSII